MTERFLIRGERVVATIRREGAHADLRTEHRYRLRYVLSASRAVVANEIRTLFSVFGRFTLSQLAAR